MSIVHSGGIDGLVISDNCFSKKCEKIIIDTDPGIVIGTRDIRITTIFGNVTTEDATRNALLLCEIAGRPDVPVAEGSPEPLKRGTPRIADFVHGSNGLGNVSIPPPKSKKSEKSASEFLVDKVSEYPGEVSILALGPLTNLALVDWVVLVQDIPLFLDLGYKERLILCKQGEESGDTWWSFLCIGNVNPAAEANIYGDPEAADIVFTSGANIDVVGINITTQVKMTDKHLDELRNSKGRHAQFICDICKFYRDWHVKSDGVYDGIQATHGQAFPLFQ
ncbi:hypothetical protein Pfo_028487 [Paulownia fortunei]|nr:hypothetical protein Pfo_028487 [Paulownia fortunei]